MPFYKGCLVYLTVLLILPEQAATQLFQLRTTETMSQREEIESKPSFGRPQCYKSWPRSSGIIHPPCCSEVSTAHINEAFVSCFEQKENTASHCGVHAFIFTTVNQTPYCVDPEAKWLSRRFQRLQRKGICCYILQAQ